MQSSQNCCTVCHILCNRSDLIQGRTISDQSVTGYCSICWFDSDYAAERTWLTDGPACVRSKCIWCFFCCHRCTASPGRSSPEHALSSMGSLSVRNMKSPVVLPMANSSMFVFPKITAPAASRFLTASAVSIGFGSCRESSNCRLWAFLAYTCYL